MGGKVVETEATNIYNSGIDKGIGIGVAKGRNEAQQDTAKIMLQDKFDFPTVAKCTQLPIARVKEIAHGLGLR